MVNGTRSTRKPRGISVSGFPDPETKSTYYRDLGRKSAESRIVLNASDAEALRQAYGLLSRIAARGKLDPSSSASPDEMNRPHGEATESGKRTPARGDADRRKLPTGGKTEQ